MKYSASTNGFYVDGIHGDNIPADSVDITEEQHITLLAGQSAGQQIVPDANGYPVLQDPPTQEITIEDYKREVQAVLDAKAKEREYDGILSLVSYATSTNPTFAAEGQAGVTWRDGAWSTCYALLGQWEAGQIPQPTIAKVLAALPAMNWPA